MPLITTAPKLEGLSLYEVLRFANMEDTDICDDVWDWVCNLGHGGYESFEEIDKEYGKDNEEGYYFKFIFLCCLNIKCVKYQPKWYSVCNVSAFINDNREAFDKFMNEMNREGYRPKDYDEPLVWDDDDEFYDVYMETFRNLVNGNYCDYQYKALVEYLLQ